MAELITNIQYACQRHYFGALAETYFDNKDRDAATNVQRRQKTIEAFYRLPEEFTVEDIMRCFGLNYDSARVKASRLQRDHLIVRIDETVGGPTKAKYKKTATIMI